MRALRALGPSGREGREGVRDAAALPSSVQAPGRFLYASCASARNPVSAASHGHGPRVNDKDRCTAILGDQVVVAIGCTGCVAANRWECWDVSSRITVPMRVHHAKQYDNQSIGYWNIFIYAFISFGGNHLERLGLLVPGSRESCRSVICSPAGGRGLLPQWPTANGRGRRRSARTEVGALE